MERKCYKSKQYSRRESLEIIGITGSFDDNVVEETMSLTDTSNVEDTCRLKLINSATQKFTVKPSNGKGVCRVLKTKPILKNDRN